MKKALIGAAIAAAAVTSAPAMASTAFVLNPGQYSVTGFSSWTLGTEFSPNSTISVTALGDFFGSGATNNTGSVGLWTDTGTLLATASVTNSTPGTDNFSYSTISAVTLTAGQKYIIAGTTNGNLYACCSTTFFTVDPALT